MNVFLLWHVHELPASAVVKRETSAMILLPGRPWFLCQRGLDLRQ